MMLIYANLWRQFIYVDLCTCMYINVLHDDCSPVPCMCVLLCIVEGTENGNSPSNQEPTSTFSASQVSNLIMTAAQLAQVTAPDDNNNPPADEDKLNASQQQQIISTDNDNEQQQQQQNNNNDLVELKPVDSSHSMLPNFLNTLSSECFSTVANFTSKLLPWTRLFSLLTHIFCPFHKPKILHLSMHITLHPLESGWNGQNMWYSKIWTLLKCTYFVIIIPFLDLIFWGTLCLLIRYLIPPQKWV